MLRYDVSTPWEGMQGDWEAGALYAGLSAALVRDVRPVAAVLRDIAAPGDMVICLGAGDITKWAAGLADGIAAARAARAA